MFQIIEKIFAANPSVDEIFNATQFDANQAPDLITASDKVMGWIVYFGAALIFIYMLISGIMLITANGNAEQAKKGQQGLIFGVIGIVVLVLALVLVRVVAFIASNKAPI